MATKKVNRPSRDPDHYSKRNVPYWFSPEWIRGTSADICDHEHIKISLEHYDNIITNNSGSYIVPCDNYGRIHAVKKNCDVELHMKSKDGNLSYIQGSIQKEFKKWHSDREIDYLLLGLDADEIITQEE